MNTGRSIQCFCGDDFAPGADGLCAGAVPSGAAAALRRRGERRKGRRTRLKDGEAERYRTD